MTHAGFVFSAWGIAFASGAIYAFALVRRGRRLSRRVEPTRRRWVAASAPGQVDATAEQVDVSGGQESHQ